MNLYFIVEGRRTEKKVYPEWLSHLVPEISRVNWAYEAQANSYYLFNGNGYPSLLHKHLRSSVEEINELQTFEYLVLILDVDETSVDFRIKEVEDFITENDIILNNCKLIIIPQNRCIETWFLGNKSIFKSNPQNAELGENIKFYNVRDNDPELMGVPDEYNTHSQFHADYCINFLRERNIRYTKNNPKGVTEEQYLTKLIERNQTTGHISSFSSFIDFCADIRSQIE